MEFHISKNDVKSINNFIFLKYKNIKEFKCRFDNKKYVLIFSLICTIFYISSVIISNYGLLTKFKYLIRIIYFTYPMILICRLYLYKLSKYRFLDYMKELNKFIGKNYIYFNENTVTIENISSKTSLNVNDIKYQMRKKNLIVYMDEYKEPLFFINSECLSENDMNGIEVYLENIEYI